MKTRIITIIFSILVTLCFLTPVIFVPWFWLSFLSSKIIYFETLVEITFPFFIFLFFSKRDSLNLTKSKILRLFFLFVCVSVISTISGKDRVNSFFGNLHREQGAFLLIHLFLFFCYLQLLFHIDQKWRNQILSIAVILAGTCGLLAVFESLRFIPSYYENFLPRASGFFANPIYLASFLTIPLFLSLYLSKINTRMRYFYFTYAVFIIAGILASGTRGALVGITAGMVIVTIPNLHKIKRKHLFMFAFAFIIMSLFAIKILPSQISSHFSSTKDNDSKFRLYYWNMALREWVHAPIFGIGPENFYIAYTKYAPKFPIPKSEWADKPHNALIELLLTEGIIGFFSFLTIVWTYASQIHNKIKHDPATLFLLGGLIAHIAQTSFIYDTISASIMFILLLSIAKDDKMETLSNKQNCKTAIPFIIASSVLSIVILFTIQIPTSRALIALRTSEKNFTSNPDIAAKNFNFAIKINNFYPGVLTESFYQNTLSSLKQTPQKQLTHQLLVSGINAYNLALQKEPLRKQWEPELKLLYNLNEKISESK